MRRFERISRLCSFRRYNKLKTGLIPCGFFYVAWSGNLGNIKWLAIMSWLTWLDASLAAWRADEG